MSNLTTITEQLARLAPEDRDRVLLLLLAMRPVNNRSASWPIAGGRFNHTLHNYLHLGNRKN